MSIILTEIRKKYVYYRGIEFKHKCTAYDKYLTMKIKEWNKTFPLEYFLFNLCRPSGVVAWRAGSQWDKIQKTWPKIVFFSFMFLGDFRLYNFN